MFTTKLAFRYIKSQKRHSALIICSITAALMLITFLMTALSTFMKCMYQTSYKDSPYHVMVNYRVRDKSELSRIEPFINAFESTYGKVNYTEGENGIYEYDRPDEYGYIAEKNVPLLFEKFMPLNSGKTIIEAVKELLVENGFFSGDLSNENSLDDYFSKPLMVYYGNLANVDPKDSSSLLPWTIILGGVFVLMLFIIFALRLLIDTAFEISSKERERQFGVLQSIGASPKQIVKIITFEALFLSVIGIPLGIAFGIGAAYIVYLLLWQSGFPEAFFTPEDAKFCIVFDVKPVLIIIGAVIGLMWMFFSAYGTGLRIVKKPPIESIYARTKKIEKARTKNLSGKGLNKLFAKIFGWEGELAARNNRRNPKRFAVSVVSLTVSITLFAVTSVAVSFAENIISGSYKASMPAAEFEFDAGANSPATSAEGNQKYGIFSYKNGIDKINQSDLFKEPMMYVINSEMKRSEDGFGYVANVMYVNKEMYSYIFKNSPPVSYEQLTKNNSYVLLDFDGQYSNSPINKLDIPVTEVSASVSADLIKSEYLDEFQPVDGDNDNDSTYYFYEKEVVKSYNIEKCTQDFIESVFTVQDDVLRTGENFIVGTMDSYENGEYLRDPRLRMFKDEFAESTIYVDLKNPDNFNKVEEFYNKNRDCFFRFSDHFEVARKLRATITLINIGANALNIMFALIAVINMINILSTGIINRKGEFASLCCIGMSEKQLNKMMILECLQYVFVAGISAVICCELISGATVGFVSMLSQNAGGGFSEIFENVVILFTEPLLKVVIALIPTYVLALLASFIPHYRLKKQSLVEQIRSEE